MDEYLFPSTETTPPPDPETLDLFADAPLCDRCQASVRRGEDCVCVECAAILDGRVADWQDEPQPAVNRKPAA